MSDLKPSKIRCRSCGYEPNIITDVCIKCGGVVVKICGNCGFENSVEKNRCDSCGYLLALSPQKKIDIEKKKESIDDEKMDLEFKEEKPSLSKSTLEFESITETIARKDESYRERIKKASERYEKDIVFDAEKERKKIENFIDEQKQKEQKGEGVSEKKQIKSFKKFFIVVAFVIALVPLYLLFFRKSYSRYDLVNTAKKYLSALRDAEYDKAYEYLSQNSKSIVSFSDYVKTLEDFYSKIGKWDFKDVEIYYFTPHQSVVKYKLIEKGIEKDDYLNFVNEYGKWKRPFVYNLFEEIDDALSKNDFPKALFLSQRLYLIDPLDPRANGYLCWSEYLMRLYDKSMESCKKVIEISNIYPIKYYSDNELFWYTFNYADSLRFSGKIEQSVEVYDMLIRDPQAESSDKCTVYLARSDSYVALKNYEKAYDDIKKSVEICSDGSIEKNQATRRLKILDGGMCEEAVMFAKKFRYQGSTVEDFIKKMAEDMGVKKYKLDYSCQHSNGSLYKITARVVSGKKTFKVYNITVDLWERNASVEEI
ncbi:MAG: hypothetical protein ACP5IO_05675 [Elusimicrobiales bacterium]